MTACAALDSVRPRVASRSTRCRPCGPSACRCGFEHAALRPPRPAPQRPLRESDQPSVAFWMIRFNQDSGDMGWGSDLIGLKRLIELEIDREVADVAQTSVLSGMKCDGRVFHVEALSLERDEGVLSDEGTSVSVLESGERCLAVIKVEGDIGEGVGVCVHADTINAGVYVVKPLYPQSVIVA